MRAHFPGCRLALRLPRPNHYLHETYPLYPIKFEDAAKGIAKAESEAEKQVGNRAKHA